MKIAKKIVIIGIALIAVALSSCQGIKNGAKDFQANFEGINRTITLYSADGTLIKSWNTGNVSIRTQGSSVDWIQNGKRVIISGTYIIEEK